MNHSMLSVLSRSVEGGSSPADMLRNLLSKLAGGSAMETSHGTVHIKCLRDAPVYSRKPSDQPSVQESHSVLW